MPGGPGDGTLAPYLTIPASQKFYVSVAEPYTRCINEDCNLDGALIQTLGGWLEVDNTYQPEVALSFGLDFPENEGTKSIVIIGDGEGRIKGIYPNKGLANVLAILKNHPDLADFSLLPGARESGMLKVGDLSPLKPGDSIGQMSEELKEKFPANHIPKDKKFYLFAIQKRKYHIVGISESYVNEYFCVSEIGCRYPEPDPPHDFLFATVDELGGWFLANDEDNLAMIKLFGMNPKEVLNGTSSLVVLTDAKGAIASLHPGKTMSDALTILSRHPELADVRGWYRE